MKVKLEINNSFLRQPFLIKASRLLSRFRKSLARIISKKETYVEAICALLIILFIYTGLNKIMDVDKFRFEMNRSPFIQDMAAFISYVLPSCELLLSLLLIIKRARLLGLYLSFALMALFTGYVWLMLNYSFDLPCSCGGIISKLSWNQHLIFNGILTVLSAVAVILQSDISKSNKSIVTSKT